MSDKLTNLFFILMGFILLPTYSLLAQIPTISIHTDEEIVDEPKVPGTLIYTDGNGEILMSNIGIEIRGGFSQTYPKKTYDIEFWNDATGSETIDVQFGNLRKDDDWVLDAMYNEPLRINSYITHKLWLDMNQLYYKEQEPKAKSGADVMYVEVSINNENQGIFMLSEQIDRFQLKLKKNTDTEIRGEMYKAYTNDDAVLFNNPDETPNNNSITWSGYEYRYPSEIIDWSNIEELVNFVANSSDEEFAQEVGNRFDIENLMDYYILINLARLLDNRGKNIYLCRYDAGEPYFFTPWDLDGSWGLLWNGNNAPVTEGALTNNLYDRLILNDVDDFRVKIAQKWNNYRMGLLSDSALDERINNAHQYLLDNGVYEKEGAIWDYQYAESDLSYLFDWLEKRLRFLDDYFSDITSVTTIDLDPEFKIYPNPTRDFISIKGNFEDSNEVKIYDMLGKLKFRYEDYRNQNRIDIKDLGSGMYVLEIGNSRATFYKY